MTFGFDRSLKTTFNSVAELYDEIRPGYPEKLIDDIISLSQISSDGKILEIGCGTGKATFPFARRGYSMLCLELGKDLANVARRNFKPYPNVDVLNTAFEDWDSKNNKFDLVISAQAFHWIPPEIGFEKIASALKRTGSIALFWNYYPEEKTELRTALDEVYERVTPHLANPPITTEQLIEIRNKEMNDSGFFEKVIEKRYPWSEQYTAEQYLKLLGTYSDHIKLPDEIRKSLFRGIEQAVEVHGGIVNRPYLAVLHFARKN